MDRNDLTFVIIAQNEEELLPGAIASCAALGKVLVVDGGSIDSTVEIARNLGARVLVNPFRYASSQYNWGLANVDTEWAFILDSDERLDDEMRNDISMLAPPAHMDAYWTDRLNFFLGKPIRHSGWSPDLNIRLMRAATVRYDDRPVHARVIVAEHATAQIRGRIRHITYRSVEQYVSKLNRFTSREVESRSQQQVVLDRRSRFRAVYLRLPFKGQVRFVYMYFIQRGFLDGRRGLDLARLSSIYESVVSIKARYAGHSGLPHDEELFKVPTK